MQILIDALGLQVSVKSEFRCLLRPDRLRVLGAKNVGNDAVEYLKNVHPLDLAFRLAEAYESFS